MLTIPCGADLAEDCDSLGRVPAVYDAENDELIRAEEDSLCWYCEHHPRPPSPDARFEYARLFGAALSRI